MTLQQPTSFLDHRLAAFFAPNNPELAQIIKQLSRALSEGHSCIQLDADQQTIIRNNPSEAWVLDDDLLYFSRYHQYETQLAQQLKRKAAPTEPLGLDAQSLHALFNDPLQQQAAELALTKQLALITGGPGTGKTTTVVKILALLMQQHPHATFALAAPTGKAAMRLQESIANSKAQLTDLFPADLLDKIPHQVSTLHRLLGARPLTPEFKHHAENPLSHDVLVVDEASMIDLALMSKLVNALKPNAKLILLGDKDQLTSVESGAVLSDCYRALADNRVELQTTYRFNEQIKKLAHAVNQQDAEKVLILCKEAEKADSQAVIGLKNVQKASELSGFIQRHYRAYFDQVTQVQTEQDILALFQTFNQFKILSATREGEFGLSAFNQLAQPGLVTTQWYAGRPVMIDKNDPSTGLYNGDIGLCLPNIHAPNSDQLKVYFLLADQLRAFVPSRLPSHQTAFAMTIHKSQGSEFAHVMIALGNQLNSQTESLVTKELLYTAITRAKSQVTLVASDSVVKQCVSNAIERHSGLARRLT
ncbi:exodeoxyribonuclease V subunit alpha [Thiomicrospira aerophila AL3]|uniref:RecBCD enzyme subunit RecD n=1 Tax=Thiomicrospira aerophila AL3 TaxID=717772 RepID=W0DW62_9GAMM|nr:exodeoxyribonuclease V subunit alpha [Thiomicrospira aerophila]AHF01523.1 exodeoxyribonuclease V subunit alpha [Thiomicrospira aerophila AL3]